MTIDLMNMRSATCQNESNLEDWTWSVSGVIDQSYPVAGLVVDLARHETF